MQYQTGTVAVTNNSQAVTGTGTKWLTDSDPVVAGDVISILGSGVFYQIGSVDADGTLHLTGNYVGATATGQQYFIIRDWTSLGLPVLQRGDVDVANMMARLANAVDALLVARTPLAACAVASLPGAGTVGRRGFVTDASATTFGGIVAGSGTNKVPVYDDGTNWRIG